MAGFLRRILGGVDSERELGRSTVSASPEPAPARPEGGSWQPISEHTARTVPAAHACVTLLGETLARLPWTVTERGRVRTPVDHPVTALLDMPSREVDRFTFWASVLRCMLVEGNAYCLIRRGRMGGMHLVQGTLQQMHRREGVWWYTLTVPMSDGYGYSYGTETVGPVPSRDVLHLRWSQYDYLLGQSESPIVTAARTALALYQASESHHEHSMHSGAHAPVMVELDKDMGTGEDYAAAMRLMEDQRGIMHAGEPVTLPPGSKVHMTGFSSVDLQLIDLLRFSIEDMARVWGVPLYLLQATSGTSPVEPLGSNLQEQFAAWHRLSLGAHISRITSELDAKLLMPRERGMIGTYIDVSMLTAGTIQDQAQVAEQLVAKAAVLTPNEMRERLGMPPVEGGDDLRQPTGAPAQDAGGGNEPDQDDQDEAEEGEEDGG